MTESDGVSNYLFPQEARLRNLTYSTPIYVEMSSSVLSAPSADDPIEAPWQPVLDADGNEVGTPVTQTFIGKVRCSSRTLLIADTHHGSCKQLQSA